MSKPQDALFDYTPSQEEEIVRLKKIAQANTARIESLMNDPVIEKFKVTAKALDKQMKELDKLREANRKIEDALLEVNLVVLDEPTEDGFYILTRSDKRTYGDRAIFTSKALFLKAMGHWFDLSNGASTVDSGSRWERTSAFEDLLDIDLHTIEATMIKVEDTTTYPAEALVERTESPRDIQEEIADIRTRLDEEEDEDGE